MSEQESQETTAGISFDVLDGKRNPVGKVELDPAVFRAAVKPHLLHQVVVYQEAKRRRGTASTKTRGEVSGSNRKPWRQKGTGRARAGEIRSPLWRGGGVIFGPKPRDYSIKVPKKVRKAALRSALSAKLQEGKLMVVDEIKLERIKTKDLLDWLNESGAGENALIVITGPDPNLELSARNLPKVKVLRSMGLNVRDLLLYDRLVMTKDALQKIQEALR